MPGQLPAVGRVVAVLNFFVEHAQQAYSLTQVARSLRLSPATTLSLLKGLVDSGYLYRRADKTYVQGPVLHGVAAGMSEPFSTIEIARQEMQALVDQFDVAAVSILLEDDAIVVREHASSSRRGTKILPYERFRLVPWGGIFFLPMTDAAIANRLHELTRDFPGDGAAILLSAITFARKNGFLPVLSDEERPVGFDPQQPTGLTSVGLDPADTYRLVSIAAPVIGRRGDVIFGLVLYGFRPGMTGADIMAVGEKLRSTCERISGFARGQVDQASAGKVI